MAIRLLLLRRVQFRPVPARFAPTSHSGGMRVRCWEDDQRSASRDLLGVSCPLIPPGLAFRLNGNLPVLGQFLHGDRIKEGHGGTELLANNLYWVLGFCYTEG